MNIPTIMGDIFDQPLSRRKARIQKEGILTLLSDQGNNIVFEAAVEKIQIQKEGRFIFKGGPGSGNYGHSGRPGRQGGSGSGGGRSSGGGSKGDGSLAEFLAGARARLVPGKESTGRRGKEVTGVTGRIKVKADSGVDESIKTSVEKDLDRVLKENPYVVKALENIPLKGGINLSSKESVSVPGVRVPKGQYAIGAYTQDNRKIQVATKRIKTEPEDITLGKFNAVSGVNGYVRHEVGHHVYAAQPQQAQRDWVQVYTHTYGMDKKVSKYAATDLEEGFTESFAVFTSSKYGKSGKKLPPPIEKHMKNLLRG